jgi:hypothetical protein
MMDREFALVLYRACMMVATYLAKRFGFGGHSKPDAEHAPDN